MKKSFTILSVTMLLMLSVNNLKAQGLQNLPCTGFNQKIVAYGTGSAQSTTTSQIDGQSYVFIDSSFTAGSATACETSNVWKTSMPTSGGSGLTYTLQAPTVNNVLQVSSNNSGTLTLTTPIYANNLYVLNLGGGNSGTFSVTVTFADSTTQSFPNLTLNDWCTGSSPVTTQLYRIPQTATSCSSADLCPYMYETNLTISTANQSKLISSISFTNTTTTQSPNPILNVFAVGGYVLTACATPLHQPTALALNPGYTTVSGSFTASTGTPGADHYLIVKNTSATLGATPVNGTTYSAGNSLGNGTIVSYQTTTSFSDTGLLKLTQYYYFIFASNSNCAVGPVYLTTTPLTGNITTNGQTIFLNSGTWVCPAGITAINVKCWGGGGGGATRSTNGGGGGGGGGAYASSTITVIPDSSYTITVGAAGAAATNGGRSNFKTLTDSVVAAGGTGVPNNDSIGGAGGTTAASRGTTLYAGGTGGAGVAGSHSGGGGGGAGTSGAGGNASGATAGTGTTSSGGNGGAGKTAQANGAAGSTYGGGGSGGYRTSSGTRTGGAGAKGLVVITIPLPPCTTPANQPTSLNLTPSYNSVSGSFTASTGDPNADHYLILRSTLSTFTASPVNGATYTVGSITAFIGGTVVAYQIGTSFTDTALMGNTQYYYFIYAANSVCTAGPLYATGSPLTGNTTTICAIPTSQPTVLSLTPGLTTIAGSFTSSSSADHYLIVRSTIDTLSASPVNGTTYIAGTSFGGGTIVGYQTDTTFTDNGLNSSTQYYYYIFAANSLSCTGGPTYLTTSPLTGNTTTNCGAPANQPTLLTLIPTSTTVAGFFTASAGTPGADHYLIVRSLTSTLSATPVNDTSYTAGASFGGGTIVAYQTSTSFTDNGLTPGTPYYYFVFAANSSTCSNGPAYLTTTPLTGNTTTNCTPPANQPTTLVLTPANTTVSGSFTASTGTPVADHYLIVRSTSATLSTAPVNGTTYTAGTSFGGGTVVAYQTGTTFTDNGPLTSGTLYYYFIYAVNTSCLSETTYLTTSPLTNSTTTTSPCTTPLHQPTVLVLTPGTTTVTGSFTASTGTPGADHYLIVRNTSSTLSSSPVNTTTYTAGASLGGGTIVAYQTGVSFTDNGPLTSGTLYYYFVFAANSNCSGGPLYLTTSPLTNNTTTITPCATPANQPTGITLTPGTSSISGSFTASTGTPGADHYLIVRNTSSTLGTLPTNGTTYTTGVSFGTGYVIAYQTGTTFTDNLSITTGVLYYYFIFAANSNCSGGPIYLTTSPLTGSAAITLQDVYVSSIVTPTSPVSTSSTQTVSIRIKNNGTVSETSIPVGYQVNAITPVTATWSGTLASGDSVSYTFTTTFTAPATGASFTLCAYTKLPTDQDTLNDKLCKTINLTANGILENSASNNIKVSPNPARDKLNINCSNISKGVTKFTIYDIQGAKLFDEETIITTDNYNKIINVSQFRTGIYFLKIENDSDIYTNKFIIE